MMCVVAEDLACLRFDVGCCDVILAVLPVVNEIK